MDYRIIIAWFIFALSIIYWDTQRLNEKVPLSDCHYAEIKIYHDRPMCTKCKMFCEVKK